MHIKIGVFNSKSGVVEIEAVLIEGCKFKLTFIFEDGSTIDMHMDAISRMPITKADRFIEKIFMNEIYEEMRQLDTLILGARATE